MDNSYQKKLYNNLNKKETRELLEIWRVNDSNTWSEEALEVIKQILLERHEQLPQQVLRAKEVAQPGIRSGMPKSLTSAREEGGSRIFGNIGRIFSQKRPYLIAFLVFNVLTFVFAWIIWFLPLPDLLRGIVLLVIEYVTFVYVIQTHILSSE